MYFIVIAINIMLGRSLDESAGHFWWPAEAENVANPDFGNLKHLQNPVNLPLTKASMLNLSQCVRSPGFSEVVS